ncbi:MULTISPECIES: phosphodiester glycosidase family protein [Cyanophyceae]|uniref:Phosphodiester glycosidase family protein n=1 Tax=Stenomitos frigidus AS-A4 TaxID=2933935 RepID=A0ABV0KLB7_9CYAN
MKPIWLMSLAGIGLGLMWFAIAHSSRSSSPSQPSPINSAPTPTPAAASLARLEYKSYALPDSTVHTLTIPLHSRYEVTPALSDTVETPAAIARREGAIAALNGGFFDPENQKSTAYIVLNGQQVADPTQNERLMSNPDLVPYLDKILNRSEFRQYQCGDRRQYAIALHRAAPPTGCELINALGGGSRLLPAITAQEEGFVAYANGTISRDALGSRQPNARTAIGITRDHSILWVMVAQKPKDAASGMTLQALADFMKTLGVEQAMNLDGGSSSSLYYDGKSAYGKVDQAGKPLIRPVKSVLLVKMKP